MNTMLLKRFTPEILQGARVFGIAPGADTILSVELAKQIEQQTGRTIGELALLGIESNASTEVKKRHRILLHETMELMSSFDSLQSPKQATASGHR